WRNTPRSKSPNHPNCPQSCSDSVTVTTMRTTRCSGESAGRDGSSGPAPASTADSLYGCAYCRSAHTANTSTRRSRKSCGTWRASRVRSSSVLTAAGAVLVRRTVLLFHRGGHVQHRGAVEEPLGSQREAGDVGRHDRPVLDAWEMCQTEGVPDDITLGVHIPIRSDPVADAAVTGILVRV